MDDKCGLLECVFALAVFTIATIIISYPVTTKTTTKECNVSMYCND